MDKIGARQRGRLHENSQGRAALADKANPSLGVEVGDWLVVVAVNDDESDFTHGGQTVTTLEVYRTGQHAWTVGALLQGVYLDAPDLKEHAEQIRSQRIAVLKNLSNIQLAHLCSSWRTALHARDTDDLIRQCKMCKGAGKG